MRPAEPGAPAPPLASDGAIWSLSGIALLVTLTVTWGFNWPMMKLAVLEVPPWTFRTLCVMVGGGALLALTGLTGGRVTFPARLLPALMLVALFNITAWHLFSAYALLYTGSGRAAIIGYTMPIWASPLSVWVLHERIGPRQILALALGMAGLGLLLAQDLGAVGATPVGGAADARRSGQLGDRHRADQALRLASDAGHGADRLAAADRRRADRDRLVAARAGARSSRTEPAGQRSA